MERTKAELERTKAELERTKAERQAEALPIIRKLSELKIKAAEHSAIRELMQHIQTYIQNGVRLEIDIPFPAADVDIKGVLATNKKERVWVKFSRGDTPTAGSG